MELGMAMGSNFAEYNVVSPVLFGAGAIAEIADKVKQFGAQKVLLIFDGGVKASGTADKVIGLLEAAGIKVSIVDDVKPDPTDASVDALSGLIADDGIELIIGLGGGSVLDTAKMAGILIKTAGPMSDHYLSKGLNPPAPIGPVICIPTTSGTGSEVSCVAVVSHAADHVKDAIFATAAYVILDPEVTATAPAHVTAYAGLDALAHALESYTSASADPFSMMNALEAIKLVAANLKTAYDDGSNIEARTNLALASNFAGIAFNNTGLHFGHSFGHELGGEFGLPHGMASSYAIPAVIKFSAKYAPERATAIAEAVGAADADAAAKQLLELMHYVGVKRFSELGITAQAAAAIAQGAIEHNVFYHNTLVPVSVEEFQDIIKGIVEEYDA
jgi:alcohol dehydrogenase class IV